MQFFNWEARPAVITDTDAWFKPVGNAQWEPADAAEVVDSGSVISEATFDNMFPSAGRPPQSQPPAPA